MSIKGEDLKRQGFDLRHRFFARPIAFDIACPRCDAVVMVRPRGNQRTPATNPRVWEPLLARFQCLSCGAVYHIGLVAWLAGQGRYATPSDQMPTVREAMELRRSLSVHIPKKINRGRDVNVLMDEPAAGGLTPDEAAPTFEPEPKE